VLFVICLIFILIIWRTINLQRSGYTGEEF
jgi:hypothetical protein